MPKPRTHDSKVQEFHVMPWQTKQRHRAQQAPERAPSFTAHQQPGSPQYAQEQDQPSGQAAQTQPQWHGKRQRPSTQSGPAPQHPSSSEQEPLEDQQPEDTWGQDSESDRQEDAVSEGTTGDNEIPLAVPVSADTCDFDDDEVVPEPTAPAARRTGRGTQPAAQTRRPDTQAHAVASVTPSSEAAAPKLSRSPVIQGRCMLAVLPGRTGMSGHCVREVEDDLGGGASGSVTGAKAAVGVMAVKVGTSSSSGHTCGVDDDEEIFKVTLIYNDGLLPKEEICYVCSTGGDLARWRLAEQGQLQRLGVTVEDPGQQPVVEVSMQALRVLTGEQAESQLAAFARKLRGMDVAVLLGTMTVMHDA